MASQAFHALALVAAARTAAHTARAVADRRAGRDASEQQDAGPARAGLVEAVRDLAVFLLLLRVRLAAAVPVDSLPRPGGETAALVQAFEGRLVLDDVARASRRAHQTLLSLYPAVSESLVEGARRLAVRAEALDPDDSRDVSALTADLSEWIDAVAG